MIAGGCLAVCGIVQMAFNMLVFPLFLIGFVVTLLLFMFIVYLFVLFVQVSWDCFSKSILVETEKCSNEKFRSMVSRIKKYSNDCIVAPSEN
jgi:hypothetical protein